MLNGDYIGGTVWICIGYRNHVMWGALIDGSGPMVTV